MVTAIPLLIRLGMHKVGGEERREPDITAYEHLPYAVEVKSCTVMHIGTRLTEVQRETTDDN